MEIAVKNIEGKDTSRKVKLNEAIYKIDPNDHAIYLDVKQYGANNRQGTHKAKERAEIAGSTKKIKRQKGTGGARFGDIKNPIFRGGGRAFGPRPRSYNFKLNRKTKVLARKSALTYKAQDNAITIVEDFSMDAPKTKRYAEILNNLSVSDKRPLLVLGDRDEIILKSSRNIQNQKVVSADDLNTYDILKYKHLVLSESAVEKIENSLNRFSK